MTKSTSKFKQPPLCPARNFASSLSLGSVACFFFFVCMSHCLVVVCGCVCSDFFFSVLPFACCSFFLTPLPGTHSCLLGPFRVCVAVFRILSSFLLQNLLTLSYFSCRSSQAFLLPCLSISVDAVNQSLPSRSSHGHANPPPTSHHHRPIPPPFFA